MLLVVEDPKVAVSVTQGKPIGRDLNISIPIEKGYQILSPEGPETMSNWTMLGIISQQASATMKKYQLGTGKEYSGTIRIVPDESEGSQAGQNRV